MNRVPLLFLNVFLIATCGLVYELIAGTLASYVLGDSVTQFSTCIGVYLTALGVGAWLSGFIGRALARTFIEVELGVALLGGFSAPLLLLSFSRLSFFAVVLYGTVFAIGVLVGLELPLLMRILRENLDFKHLVARVLTFDYIGALAGSLLFPMFLVPHLGLVRTSLVFGILNGVVGLWGTWILRSSLTGGVGLLRLRAVIVLALLGISLLEADRFTTLAEDELFGDPVVYARTSPYQRIVVTGSGESFELYLNGNLQFSALDEYRYHEALVHPAMLSAARTRRVLVLGGGDGLALREILKYPDVREVTLVDLDPAMTGLSSDYPPLGQLNERALDDPRVTIVNRDAFVWVETAGEPFDVVIVDFPDPNNFSLGKLYTRRFYRLLRRHVSTESAIGIQCTSPYFTRQAYWCIVHTLEDAGFHVHPYQAPVPSFGVWGFALARLEQFEPPRSCPLTLRFLNGEVLESLFVIPQDMARVETDVNRLDNQILVQYYDAEINRQR